MPVPELAAPVVAVPSARRPSLPGTWLAVLTVAFAGRVVAQPLSLVPGFGWLPPFEAWHSATLPYGLLLASQILILAALARTTIGVQRGTVLPKPSLGRPLALAGTAYAGAMLARLVLGATLLSDVRWFASPLPTVFHLILASWVLVCAAFHARWAWLERLLPSLHYPVVITLAFAGHAALRAAGVSLTTSTYLPIVATALVVAGLERLHPDRRDWQPEPGDLGVDFLFLALVQLALPPLVRFFFTATLLGPAAALNLPTGTLWPHQWPLWLQTVLMILAVDFMRYWLHRAAHETDVLWRLHSVHHSVDRLYWLNTSRFHPVEKALQMCVDSLPFLLMSVDARVLALYYLAYSTNGFFQHCNIRLRYGFLNYVVSSAEAHRWHHSRQPREANTNYGSTVIVWDLLFGTWFLPSGRRVVDLGLHDRAFPQSFAGLMRAPFRR
jgi:sterol desaturase/sphingolipid hydroxylase (fatty acid hydroxylase superfamily)